MKLFVAIVLAMLIGFLIGEAGEILEWDMWFVYLVSAIAGFAIGFTLWGKTP